MSWMKCPYCEWPIDPENKKYEMGSECICDVKNEPWVVKMRAFVTQKIPFMQEKDEWFSFDDEWDINVYRYDNNGRERMIAAAYPVVNKQTKGDVWIPLVNYEI